MLRNRPLSIRSLKGVTACTGEEIFEWDLIGRRVILSFFVWRPSKIYDYCVRYKHDCTCWYLGHMGFSGGFCTNVNRG